MSYKPVNLQAQQRLQEEGCVVDINHPLALTSGSGHGCFSGKEKANAWVLELESKDK